MIFAFFFPPTEANKIKKKSEREREIHSKSINREIFEQRGSFGTLVSRIEFRNWETSRGSRVAMKHTTTYVVQECFFFFFFIERTRRQKRRREKRLCAVVSARGVLSFLKALNEHSTQPTRLWQGTIRSKISCTPFYVFFLSLFSFILRCLFFWWKNFFTCKWDKWEKKNMIR